MNYKTPWPLSVALAAGMIFGGWFLGLLDSTPRQQPVPAHSAAKVEPKPPAPPELTEEQKAEEAIKKAAREKENIRAAIEFAALKQLKSSMKNPASFDLESALRMDDGTVCVSYRATNSFNAVVPGSAVITATKIITTEDRKSFTSEWNKRCANKSGVNLRGLRSFL